MSDSINGTAVYLVPGMSIKIQAPVNGRNQAGFFVREEAVPESYWENASNAGSTGKGDFIPLKGFILEDNNVGSLSETDTDEAAVIYKHEQPYPNAIWFFARTGERGVVNVISVPIHDHSTIVHGGPAYGTYFDDDIER